MKAIVLLVCMLGLIGCGGSEPGSDSGGKLLGDAALVGNWKADDGSYINVSDSPSGDLGNWRTHSNADDDRPNEMGNFRIEKKGVITTGDDDHFRYTISGGTLEITTPSGKKISYKKE